jgi:hypothetical protein
MWMVRRILESTGVHSARRGQQLEYAATVKMDRVNSYGMPEKVRVLAHKRENAPRSTRFPANFDASLVEIAVTRPVKRPANGTTTPARTGDL